MPIRSITKHYHKPDYVLIGIFAALIIFGLIMLSSAGAAIGYEKFGDSYYYLKHQFFSGLLPGLFFLFIASRMDYRLWKKIAFPLIVLSIVLLILVFIPGLNFSYGGATRWLRVGGFIFQPTEIVKLALVIYLAAWLEKKNDQEISDLKSGLLPFIGILGLIMLLIILQPDIGTMVVTMAIAITVYYIAGARNLHILGLGVLGLGLLTLLIKIAPYRMARFMTFLHPELDPKGIGYHITQAFLAIGSGGIFGRGFGQSRQKFQYLPEVTGDSIFAVIAEELGFIFSLVLIATFLFLMYRGFRMAKSAPDNFGRLLAVGIISWFVLQAFINIGAMSGILPLTGIPLPFISYGGSSLAVSLAAIGILINISRQTKEI
jgi:cell division protein FtsW